jgi:hypothetical protein
VFVVELWDLVVRWPPGMHCQIVTCSISCKGVNATSRHRCGFLYLIANVFDSPTGTGSKFLTPLGKEQHGDKQRKFFLSRHAEARKDVTTEGVHNRVRKTVCPRHITAMTSTCGMFDLPLQFRDNQKVKTRG